MDTATQLTYQADLARGIKETAMTPLLATGDQQAHRIVVEVLRSGRPVDITGVSITGGFVRADDVTVPLTGTVVGGKAQVTLPQACYRVSGPFGLAIRLVQGKEISTIFVGRGVVTRVDSDSVIDPEHKIPSLEELLAMVDKLEQVTETASGAATRATSAAGSAETAAGKANTAATAAETAKKTPTRPPTRPIRRPAARTRRQGVPTLRRWQRRRPPAARTRQPARQPPPPRMRLTLPRPPARRRIGSPLFAATRKALSATRGQRWMPPSGLWMPRRSGETST